MKWLILGGGGVFGVHLARHLLGHRAERVVAVGRNVWPSSPFSLDTGRGDPRLRYEQIHMLHEPERLQALLDHEQPEVVVNFAALAYATSWTDARRYYETNVVALARLTEFLMGKPWLHRFVQIGTSELYGSVTSAVNEDAPLKPTSPYAVSKMAGDLHLLTLTPQGFPAIVMRPSNCYGEGQALYRVMPRAAWCAVTGTKLPLEGGGVVRKSYMHASDLASAITVAVEKGEPGQVYNAGPDDPVAIRFVVDAIARAAKMNIDDLIEPAPGRAGEDRCYWLDSSKIRALDWAPKVGLDDGAFRMLTWARMNKSALQEPEPFVLRA